MTAPDMAMSVHEIMLRHASGRPVPSRTDMFYGGDTLYPNVKSMSAMDQLDMIRENNERLEALQAELEGLRSKRHAAIKAAQAKAGKAEVKQSEAEPTEAIPPKSEAAK